MSFGDFSLPVSTVQDDDSWLGRRRKDSSDDSSWQCSCCVMLRETAAATAWFPQRKRFNAVQQARFVSARTQNLNNSLKVLRLEDVVQRWNKGRKEHTGIKTVQRGGSPDTTTQGCTRHVSLGPVGTRDTETETWERFRQHSQGTDARDSTAPTRHNISRPNNMGDFVIPMACVEDRSDNETQRERSGRPMHRDTTTPRDRGSGSG